MSMVENVETVRTLMARLERVMKGIHAIQVDIDEDIPAGYHEILVRKNFAGVYLSQANSAVEAAHMTLRKLVEP